MAPNTANTASSSEPEGSSSSDSQVFTFVDYPTNASLGRGYLQKASIKQHFIRRRANQLSGAKQKHLDLAAGRGSRILPQLKPKGETDEERFGYIRSSSQSDRNVSLQFDSIGENFLDDDGMTDVVDEYQSHSQSGSSSSSDYGEIIDQSPENISQGHSGTISVSDWAVRAGFASLLPVELDEPGLRLLQHHFIMPNMLYQVKEDCPIILHRDGAFPLGITHPAFLFSLLATAGAHRDAENGWDTQPESIKYKLQAFRSLQNFINNSEHRFTPESFVLVVCMANLEHIVGSQDSFRIHCKAMQNIWRAMGGAKSLVPHPHIDYVSCSILVVLSKAQSRALDISYRDGTKTPTYFKEVGLGCRQLLQLVSDILEWYRSLEEDDAILSFCSKSPWFQSLIFPSPMVDHHPNPLLRSRSKDGKRSIDMFILLSICFLVLKHRKKPQRFIGLMEELCDKLHLDKKENTIHKYAVLWTFTKGLEDDIEDKWEVLDMVRSLHRFKGSSQNRILQALACPFIPSFMLPNEVLDGKGLQELSSEASMILHDLAGSLLSLR